MSSPVIKRLIDVLCKILKTEGVDTKRYSGLGYIVPCLVFGYVSKLSSVGFQVKSFYYFILFIFL